MRLSERHVFCKQHDARRRVSNFNFYLYTVTLFLPQDLNVVFRNNQILCNQRKIILLCLSN